MPSRLILSICRFRRMESPMSFFRADHAERSEMHDLITMRKVPKARTRAETTKTHPSPARLQQGRVPDRDRSAPLKPVVEGGQRKRIGREPADAGDSGVRPKTVICCRSCMARNLPGLSLALTMRSYPLAARSKRFTRFLTSGFGQRDFFFFRGTTRVSWTSFYGGRQDGFRSILSLGMVKIHRKRPFPSPPPSGRQAGPAHVKSQGGGNAYFPGGQFTECSWTLKDDRLKIVGTRRPFDGKDTKTRFGLRGTEVYKVLITIRCRKARNPSLGIRSKYGAGLSERVVPRAGSRPVGPVRIMGPAKVDARFGKRRDLRASAGLRSR